MEFDTFLTQPRWQLLEIIANNPSSPVQLSEDIGTSVAYVSQQLKILEAAGIVKKERTRAVQRGKPRLLYSISEDVIHITSLINNFPIKKKIVPSNHQKITIKIWMLENKGLQYITERLFWRVEPFLNEIDNISLDLSKDKAKIFISSSKDLKSITQKLSSEVKDMGNFEILLTENKNQDSSYIIYDSNKNNQEQVK